jgi:hypothetical protein
MRDVFPTSDIPIHVRLNCFLGQRGFSVDTLLLAVVLPSEVRVRVRARARARVGSGQG